RDTCEQVKAAARDDEAKRAAWHRNRALRTRRDVDGAGVLEAKGPPEVIAELRAHLVPFERAVFNEARREGRREAHEAYAFDALMAMARAASGSDGEGKRPSAKVISRIDWTAMLRGYPLAGETCEIAGVGPVPVSVIADLIDRDAFVAAVITKGKDVCTVAH